MTLNLTARTVENLKPTPGKRVDYFDHTVPGFALRVTEKGVKSWTVHYRTGDGRLWRLTLGRYPAIPLGDARKLANKALRKAGAGENPALDKQDARRGETFGDLANYYIEKYAKVKKRSWEADDRMLAVEVLPAWRHRKVKDLTRREVRELVEAIAERGSPITANRCLALVRKILNFAIEKDWIEGNVASRIEKPGEERSRERVLTDDEIRLVWDACAVERAAMCALTRLRLVTAQRGGELAKLRWSDIDGDWLTIPATVAKNKRAHRVPLTVTAQTLLATVLRTSDEWVFPGRSDQRPLGDHKKAGQRIAARVLAELTKTDPILQRFDFRAHDLRRTASTKMAEAGVSQGDIAKVLNHVDGEGGSRATRVYNRYAYDREKRLALETWERTLIAILEKRPAPNVVSIRDRKGA